MTFGERLRRLRYSNNLSQEKLGKKIGTAQTNISEWELGKNSPDVNQLAALAVALETTASYLVEGIGNPTTA